MFMSRLFANSAKIKGMLQNRDIRIGHYPLDKVEKILLIDKKLVDHMIALAQFITVFRCVFKPIKKPLKPTSDDSLALRVRTALASAPKYSTAKYWDNVYSSM